MLIRAKKVKPKLSDFQICGKSAPLSGISASLRQVLSLRNPAKREIKLFRYSRLCGTASEAVDAVILLRRINIGNPVGFQILEI
jgi:hypothetical protein